MSMTIEEINALIGEANETAEQFDRGFPEESAEADLLRRLATAIAYLDDLSRRRIAKLQDRIFALETSRGHAE